MIKISSLSDQVQSPQAFDVSPSRWSIDRFIGHIGFRNEHLMTESFFGSDVCTPYRPLVPVCLIGPVGSVDSVSTVGRADPVGRVGPSGPLSVLSAISNVSRETFATKSSTENLIRAVRELTEHCAGHSRASVKATLDSNSRSALIEIAIDRSKLQK